MKAIAVLLTVHNRKSKTLACLEALYVQHQVEGYRFDVYLVDDGCTDGTGEAVAAQFPLVNIIQGDGQLFWNRGMHVAWKEAAKKGDYDFYFWLNDDTILYPNAFEVVLESYQRAGSPSIISGPTWSKLTQSVSYSGLSGKDQTLLTPNGEIQECNIVNGNFLLVPREVYNTIGNLDWTFRHAIGDFDYGLRAQKAGFKCYIATNFVATCDPNPTLPKWCLPSTPLKKRFQILYSPLGYADPTSFFIYEKRHFGIVTATKHFLTINLRALIPGLWK